MTDYIYSSENQAGECKPLMDACTPFVYRHNAYRITGLLADASVRDIKRRIDDLKHAEEMGDADEEHSHAFALRPPPSLEHIREAALRLQDPERRIVEEFFWFWPLDWENAKRDAALQALTNGDKKSPYQIWTGRISDDHSDQSIISKHNLAVLYQMTALDGELLSLEKTLTEESLTKLEKYWRTSFVWWEELADSEPFWSLVSARIRMLDDPRLTTGFARRMRATLPEALDKINALLALRYVENGNLGLARKHIAFMQETHQGLDDVSKTLAIVTSPLITRIRDAVDRANQIAERSPIDAADAAEELFETTRQPIDIIRSILPQNDHARIDICDAVAETGLLCSNAFVREERDLPRCLSILSGAEGIAESEDSKRKISDVARVAQGAVLLEPILAACEQAANTAQNSPENALAAAEELLSTIRDGKSSLEQPGVSSETRTEGLNNVAATVMQCAVVYGNSTEEWQPCISILETSSHLATDGALKARIAENLRIVRENAKHEELFATCWFCKSNKAEESSKLDVPMYGDVQRKWTFGGTRVNYRKMVATVPRCSRCKTAHNHTSNAGCLLAIIGAIIGSFPLPIIGIIIGGFVGWGIGSLIGNAIKPSGVASEGTKSEYPPIRELRSKGWEIGDKPS